MLRALWTSASGMQAQQLHIDTISNNLANVNTIGFKRSRVEFQDLPYQTLTMPGATSSSASGTQVPTGAQVGHGARPVATRKIFSNGNYKQTDVPLDLVIEGKGFFQVIGPDGNLAYTRAGAFKEDSQGRLVTSDGFRLQPNIIIPPEATSTSISPDGTVEAIIPGQNTPQQVGNIQLVRFPNPSGLESIGRGLYKPTASSGQSTTGTPGQNGLGTLLQGFLEMSNVQLVEEMVGLITAQRAYEVNSKGIQAADQMLNTANNLRR